MASTSATPYGLVPVKRSDGMPYNGAIGEYRVQSGYATALYNGMPVQYTGGYITACSAGNMGTTAAPDEYIGVFMGCSYTDPTTGTKVWRQYLPASTSASDIVAFVADDPNLVFKVQANSTAYNALAAIGTCLALSGATGGSTVTGNSSIALDTDGTPAAGPTLPFKVVGLSGDPTNVNAATGSYLDVLVTVNRSFHVLANNNA